MIQLRRFHLLFWMMLVLVFSQFTSMSYAFLQSSREMLLQLSLKDLSIQNYSQAEKIVCNENWQKLFKAAKQATPSSHDLFQFHTQPFMPSHFVWSQSLQVDINHFKYLLSFLPAHSSLKFKPPLV